MKKLYTYSLFPLLLCLSACVTTDIQYTPPAEYPKANIEKIINKPKSTVWKTLLKNLSQDFFVINTIEKESGIISLSYSGTAEKYVDCGVINSYVKNLAGERRYIFNVATPYQKYELEPLLIMERSSNLSERINILVQEEAKGKTKVSVNVRYVLLIKASGQKLFAGSNWEPRNVSFSNTYSFNSNGKETKNNGSTCVANGILENEILNLAK